MDPMTTACADAAHLPDDPLPQPQQTPAYTLELTRRVHRIVEPFWPITQEMVEHVITEALFQAAADLRGGKAAELEYLGELRRIELPGGPVLRYRALPDLLEVGR